MTEDELKVYRKVYWKTHREKLLAYGREYREKNRLELSKRRRLKYRNDPVFRAYELERHARKRQPKQPVIRLRDNMGRFMK